MSSGGDGEEETKKQKEKREKQEVYRGTQGAKSRLPVDSAVTIMLFVLWTLSNTIFHSNTLAAEAYSSPSIIMSSRRHDGSRFIIDDYREAYYWLKQNTPKEAKIMSWWDYGY